MATVSLILLFITPTKGGDPQTFWLIQRVSIITKTSITGIPPGTKVTLMKENGANLTVTDGAKTFEVSRAQVTTNIDVARQVASADYSAQVEAARTAKKELAAVQKSQAADKKARATAQQENSMAANPKQIIGHVRYEEDGGLIIECDEPRPGRRAVASYMGRIGGGGGVSGAPEPQQSEVEGIIWLTGHPRQRDIADGDSINVHAYEAGIHQSSNGSRIRQYKFISTGN